MGSRTVSLLARATSRNGFRNNGTRLLSTSSQGRIGNVFKAAIIGSGPAGFYTAQKIMNRIPEAAVDMYESMPVPFGLVRFGVAPDHPEVKNCQVKFEETAASPKFHFIGNVTVGQPDGVEISTLLRHYHAVIFAYGAAKDSKLEIPGESTLQGIYSARQFVGWYNGHPEYASLSPDLTRGEEAVIIGQGNVSLDVARMLLEHVDNLRKTDISEAALAELSASKIKRVHIVGRRGPMQAAFTIKEIRELIRLGCVAFHDIDKSLIPTEMTSLSRGQRRKMELLVKGTKTPLESAAKSWSLDFCLSPRRFIESTSQPGAVGHTEFDTTELSPRFAEDAKAHPTGEVLAIPSQFVFRSIGYKSVALLGFAEAGIPFDTARGVIKNDGLGRVLRAPPYEDLPEKPPLYFPGLYCSGWVKRGPTGVIASTLEDAFVTGETVAQDWLRNEPFLDGETYQKKSGWDGVKGELGSPPFRVVTWSDWHKIDNAEKERGRQAGKDSEKFASITEMLSLLD